MLYQHLCAWLAVSPLCLSVSVCLSVCLSVRLSAADYLSAWSSVLLHRPSTSAALSVWMSLSMQEHPVFNSVAGNLYMQTIAVNYVQTHCKAPCFTDPT